MNHVNGRSAAIARPLMALAIMLLAFALLELSSRPPAPLPVSAPAEQFAAGRAMQTIERLLGDSDGHPTGSAQNASVRQRVVDEMTGLGLSVETQETFVCQPRWAVCGEVANVMARLPGASDGPAVLLTAHYDSVAAGPGAGDDMAGVAASLEVARILASEPPLANPVILLFTDGEEIALLGAQAFFDEHPWAEEVGVVVNLEANGTSGQSFLFETTHASGWLAETLTGRVPRLVGNSFADSLYTILPFNTDLTVYEQAELPGVNFAFVESHAQYHTPLDTPGNLDPGSLQHHGDNALAAVRAFGVQDLRNPPTGERVYADLLPWVFVSWPVEWTSGLALGLGLGWFAATLVAIRLRLVTLRQVLWGMAALPVSLLLAVILGVMIGLLAQWSSGAPVPWYGQPGPIRVVLWGASLLIVAVVASLLKRRASGWGLIYGAWLGWAVPSLVVGALWPPASFLFLVPILVALIPACLLLLPRFHRLPGVLTAAAGIGLFGACWMWLWFARGSDVTALSPEFAATATVAITLAATAGASLFAVQVAARKSWAALGVGVLFLGLAALAIGAVNPVYSTTAPQPLNVLRIEDTQAGEVRWALDAQGPVPEAMLRTRQFGAGESQVFPWQSRRMHVAPDGVALTVEGPGRAISRAADNPLSLSLPAAPDGSQVAVHIPAQAGVEGFVLSRQGSDHVLARPSMEDGYIRFMCIAPACSNVDLDVALSSNEPFTAFVTQTVSGLPQDDDDLIQSRPADAAPRHGGDATILVERIVVYVE